MLSQQNDVSTFSQSPMVLIGSIRFLEQHRSSKSCAPLHKSNLWNILDTNESVLWNILEIVSHQLSNFFRNLLKIIHLERGQNFLKN